MVEWLYPINSMGDPAVSEGLVPRHSVASAVLENKMLLSVSSYIQQKFSDIDEMGPSDIPLQYIEGRKKEASAVNENLVKGYIEFTDNPKQHIDEKKKAASTENDVVARRIKINVEAITAESLLPEYLREKRAQVIHDMAEQYSAVPNGLPTLLLALIELSNVPTTVHPIQQEYREYVADVACVALRNVEMGIPDRDNYGVADFRSALAEFKKIYQMLDSRHLFDESPISDRLSKNKLAAAFEYAEFADDFFTVVFGNSENVDSVFQSIGSLFGSVAQDREEHVADLFIFASLKFRQRVLEGELKSRIIAIGHAPDMSIDEKQQAFTRIREITNRLHTYKVGQEDVIVDVTTNQSHKVGEVYLLLDDEHYQRVIKSLDAPSATAT